MAIEQGLFQLITSNTAVKTGVGLDKNGVAAKAFWVLAPQGTAVPFLVLSRVSTNDTYTMAGSANFRDALFQVVAYASTYYPSRNVADTVRRAIENFKGTLPDTDATVVSSIVIEKDFDMNYEEGSLGFIYGAFLQFRVWYRDTNG